MFKKEKSIKIKKLLIIKIECGIIRTTTNYLIWLMKPNFGLIIKKAIQVTIRTIVYLCTTTSLISANVRAMNVSVIQYVCMQAELNTPTLK
jgi:hypothetical protein